MTRSREKVGGVTEEGWTQLYCKLYCTLLCVCSGTGGGHGGRGQQEPLREQRPFDPGATGSSTTEEEEEEEGGDHRCDQLTLTHTCVNPSLTACSFCFLSDQEAEHAEVPNGDMAEPPTDGEETTVVVRKTKRKR